MAVFKEVNVRQPVSEREEKILDYWRDNNIAEKSITEKQGKKQFVFFEGPPTANGKPGIHHVLARTLKDVVCRYKTMQGFQVKRKAGWDTHGLPVEIEVEKTLGLSNKNEIEDYGIEQFNKKCRESVFTYESDWRKLTERIGYWIDMDNPYITLDNNYVESVWWILNKFFKEGLIYRGHKILPYCTRCGTPLASHEVSQGYKDIEGPSIYVRMKIKGKDNEYFLVWTTTPWTLPSNVALAVHPENTYVRVKFEDTIYIMVKNLVEKVFKENYEILEDFSGTSLEGVEYEQLIPFVKKPEDKKAFYVVSSDFVTTEDGTGIVHIAPAFGEDDYQTGRKNNLPVFQPVNEQGHFIDAVEPWKGMHVMSADPLIIKWLKNEGKLFLSTRYTHSYPHCWRCQTPLLYYARKGWYIEVTKFKDKLIEANNSVNWFPKFVGEGRFGNWLENLIDWSISRDRYWGTPLPVWICKDCGHMDSVGSIEELKQKSTETLKGDVDLHRPYVDNIKLKCEKCGGFQERTLEVIDCWFDSGAMPFAQHHYPFENKDIFEKELFPADFICEGIDQTRGWFYSLLAISVFVKGKSPYKTVVVNDLVLDKDGYKMSKSRGNAVFPDDIIKKFGADATRWYLLENSPPWLPKKFDISGVKEVVSKFLGTLLNTYSFFVLYANIDDFNPEKYSVDYGKLPEIDRWIMSKLNNLIKNIKTNMAIFEFSKVTRALQNFVMDDLSNWYVRRCRRRFWALELTEDKIAVYLTLHKVLVDVAKLIAPFAPFLSEEIFRNLTQEKKPSVHFEDYLIEKEEYIDNALEEKMDIVKRYVYLGRAIRNNVQIKVRQPLSKFYVSSEHKDLVLAMEDLIKEEINVKEVLFSDSIDEFISYDMKPDFKVMGPKYGKLMKSIAKTVQTIDTKKIMNDIKEKGFFLMSVDGEDLKVVKEDFVIKIKGVDGYAVEENDNLFAVIDISLTADLINEGLAREMVSKIQTMRKNNNFETMDNIEIYYTTTDKVNKAVNDYSDYIKQETLAKKIKQVDSIDDTYQKWSLNGEETFLFVKKI